MTTDTPADCPHDVRNAQLYCGSYFVVCAACRRTLITIPWFSAAPLLSGSLKLARLESPQRETIAEGPAASLIPHVPQILMCGERLALTGEQAVINESQLGDIKNNSLEIQRDYFSRVVAANPRDEFAPFALAQVLRELGDHQQANATYDAAIDAANANWLLKLPAFALPSLVIAAVLWQQAFTPWLVGIVALLGPAFWLVIRRNRHRGLPSVGFAHRAATAAQIDMQAQLATGNATNGREG